MSWASKMFGETLLVKSDTKPVGEAKPTSEVLGGKKFVVLYFSAHWCGPCRKFTPLLSIAYEDMTDAAEVEVVFVSADHDQEGFNEYYAEMPWTSVPFDAARREAISEEMGVEGIPRVIVLNGADGTVHNSDARDIITQKKKLNGIF